MPILAATFIDKPRMWSVAEREAEFDPEVALAAFDTPEVAIRSRCAGGALRDWMDADRRLKSG